MARIRTHEEPEALMSSERAYAIIVRPFRQRRAFAWRGIAIQVVIPSL